MKNQKTLKVILIISILLTIVLSVFLFISYQNNKVILENQTQLITNVRLESEKKVIDLQKEFDRLDKTEKSLERDYKQAFKEFQDELANKKTISDEYSEIYDAVYNLNSVELDSAITKRIRQFKSRSLSEN